ncbi:MAG TPA: sulfatase-like hydrolase/transferase, partial [Candidatus Binatia bacterium]|nr:sulfatase-like hydrolase/transferase [Candidatus Binatia bacterium]
MARPLNVVLLVVDSLRARSLIVPEGPTSPRTPFLDRLAGLTAHFTRAHATECWTLPSHLSMFTGLLPSEHGAHFRSLAYRGTAPTIAELLAAAGYQTELVTRNSMFDGTLPGVNRGFQETVHPLSPLGTGLNPLAIMLALSKPRFRRQIRTTGFFNPIQRASREFVTTFARATLPADVQALDHVLARMAEGRRRERPYFLFCNLYDVHAPYPPSTRSIFPPLRDGDALLDWLVMPFVLPCLGGHAYLRPGFRLSARSRRLLLARYHRAIELMDRKLERFYDDARGAGLLDDTLLVIVSDHGEAFG